MKFYFTLILILIGSSLMAATNIVNCDYLSIANACAAANEADILLIVPGDCYISNTITINRSVSFTIAGSGTNLTTLRAGPNVQTFLVSSQSSSNNIIFRDFRSICSPQTTSGFINIGKNLYTSYYTNQFVIYNVRFENISGRALGLGYMNANGLVKSCSFFTTSGNFTVISFGGAGYWNWTNSVNNIGTTNTVVIEDCYFWTTNNIGNGFIDGYDGCQIVLRHNVFDGTAANGPHGYESDQTSVKSVEAYNNIFINQNSDSANVMLTRGGTEYWFSNTIYAISPKTSATVSSVLDYYRACNGSYQGAYGYAGYPMTNFPIQVSGNWTNPPVLVTNWVAGQTWQVGNTKYIFDSVLTNSLLNHVLLGSDLAHSITNLSYAINWDLTQCGTLWSQASTNGDWWDNSRNADLGVWLIDTNIMIMTNVMDGPYSSGGYPAAFQIGLYSMTKFTNSPVTMKPCYSWSNTWYLNGALQAGTVNFVVAYNAANCNGTNNVTQLMQQNRDYYNDTITPGYTPLVYPHPLTPTNQLPLIVNTITANNVIFSGNISIH